jgi:lactoylglutathione lyase
MTIEHIGLQVHDLEKMKDFYAKAFGFAAGKKYRNERTGWESYFLTSPDGGSRLELRSHPSLAVSAGREKAIGFIHLALSLGSREAVEKTTAKLSKLGYRITSLPRTTGDGYFEAGVEDPEGNLLELTV